MTADDVAGQHGTRDHLDRGRPATDRAPVLHAAFGALASDNELRRAVAIRLGQEFERKNASSKPDVYMADTWLFATDVVLEVLAEHPADLPRPGDVAAADGWDLVNPGALYAAAVHAVAWELLEQTSDTADQPPSEESIHEARATAEKILGAVDLPVATDSTTPPGSVAGEGSESFSKNPSTSPAAVFCSSRNPDPPLPVPQPSDRAALSETEASRAAFVGAEAELARLRSENERLADRFVVAEQERAAWKVAADQAAAARNDWRVRAQAAEQEAATLRRWKAEALPVIGGLQELGRALGLPLGTQITGPEAVEAAAALRTQVAAAEDQSRAVMSELVELLDGIEAWATELAASAPEAYGHIASTERRQFAAELRRRFDLPEGGEDG